MFEILICTAFHEILKYNLAVNSKRSFNNKKGGKEYNFKIVHKKG